MTDKAYIVANEQQEREVLEKLERLGAEWYRSSKKPTDFIPSHVERTTKLPYALLVENDQISWCDIEALYEFDDIVYDGRKEEHMSDTLDRTLTIFTNNGQTFMFKYVTDFKYTTTGFEFSYTGKTTGVERHAVFNNTSVAGYALAD